MSGLGEKVLDLIEADRFPDDSKFGLMSDEKVLLKGTHRPMDSNFFRSTTYVLGISLFFTFMIGGFWDWDYLALIWIFFCLALFFTIQRVRFVRRWYWVATGYRVILARAKRKGAVALYPIEMDDVLNISATVYEDGSGDIYLILDEDVHTNLPEDFDYYNSHPMIKVAHEAQETSTILKEILLKYRIAKF